MIRTYISLTILIGLSLWAFGCKHHAYVSLTPGQDIRDVEIPSGNMQLIRNASSSFIVGLA